MTADPVLSQVGEAQCANFTIASDSNTKDANGEYITNFYRAAAWRRQAELCAQYLHKGDLVAVAGDLCIRPYHDKNGTERVSIQLTIGNIDFCRTRKNSEPAEAAPQAAPQTAPPDDDDELPF